MDGLARFMVYSRLRVELQASIVPKALVASFLLARAARHGRPGMSAVISCSGNALFSSKVSTAAGLIAALVLPYLGFMPTTINRILVWGVFGIGFDILFGFTGLLSFGQSAFFGTGGMVAAYLLTIMSFLWLRRRSLSA